MKFRKIPWIIILKMRQETGDVFGTRVNSPGTHPDGARVNFMEDLEDVVEDVVED
jgi:hypothetical protein